MICLGLNGPEPSPKVGKKVSKKSSTKLLATKDALQKRRRSSRSKSSYFGDIGDLMDMQTGKIRSTYRALKTSVRNVF